MRIAVLDTETTGMRETDQVLELAIVSWRHGDQGRDDRWSSLIRPTCPVSVGARAVHHVSDAMLADKWTFGEMMKRRGLPELGLLGENRDPGERAEEPVVVAAHNMAFDERMLRQSGFTLTSPTICTWRCAMHLYPDSEDGHSNQVLRYYLGLEVPPIKSLPPHRALPDALVTAAVLKHMLADHEPEELVALSSKKVVQKKVNFGTHRGKLWKDMDSGFLNWVLGRDFNDDVKHTARAILEERRKPLLQP